MDTESQRFPFFFDPRFRPFLLTMGVRPGNSFVELGGGTLRVRFGPWRLETGLDNVECVEITGPYKAYRAIGVRGSLVDRGITYGSNTRGGVCVVFKEPVPSQFLDSYRHPGMTVTVADLDGFAAAVVAAAE